MLWDKWCWASRTTSVSVKRLQCDTWNCWGCWAVVPELFTVLASWLFCYLPGLLIFLRQRRYAVRAPFHTHDFTERSKQRRHSGKLGLWQTCFSLVKDQSLILGSQSQSGLVTGSVPRQDLHPLKVTLHLFSQNFHLQ